MSWSSSSGPHPPPRRAAAPRYPCSRNASSHGHRRPGCRRRGPRRAREAEARKNEPTEPRRSVGSMPDPNTPLTARRAVAHLRGAPVRVLSREHDRRPSRSAVAGVAGKINTHPHGERPAPRTMSRAEELAHRSERRGTAPETHEDRSGRNAGTPNARRKTAAPPLRQREFPKSGSCLHSSRMQTRARGTKRGFRRLRTIEPDERAECGRRCVKRHQAQPPDVVYRVSARNRSVDHQDGRH